MGIKWNCHESHGVHALFAKLWSRMDFDDSLFEQEDRRGLKRVEASKVSYLAKRCELNVSQCSEIIIVATYITKCISHSKGCQQL